MKGLAILGSTGSIGRQTLEVVSSFPEKLRVVALAAGWNTELLRRQVARFKPKLVSTVAGKGPSLEDLATHPEVDLVVVATSGRAGLAPTLAALRAGKRVALANKEVLVMAGEIVVDTARRQGVEILPIDSEHSALWQCLQGEERESVLELLLTASGGPFRGLSLGELAGVTPQQALRHPTWQMGKKVTIDSATLMNKGFEAIEARWLFDVPLERIRVVLHPESIVHSLVHFADGSLKALLSPPDMRLPIQYALSYPERWGNPLLPRLAFDGPLALHFEEVDRARFPCLDLALEAGRKGGTYPAVLSGADEAAVELFLGGRIGFLDIAQWVAEALAQHRGIDQPSLEEVLAAEAWAREKVESLACK